MSANRTACWLLIVGVVALVATASHFLPPPAHAWSAAEQTMLRSLWLENLPPLPPDPSNAVAENSRAAQLGHRLFFDTRLSPSDAIACATCHRPELRFTDGMQKGRGVGQSQRNTMSIVGAAYSPWQYWDGRRDSQWSQALTPIEDPAEHGGSRQRVAQLIAGDPVLRRDYEALFGALPNLESDANVDRVFANVGKAIAAYERLLLPGPSRFDAYVEALLNGDPTILPEILSDDEALGLRLFIGKGNCTQCHNGPLLTNHEFHNTGLLSYPGELPDKGRADGIREVRLNPFNCLGAFSDADESECAELTFARSGPEVLGALRTPSLRNLEHTAPYMHKGQLFTLAEVLEHYNTAPLAMIGHNEAKPLGLSPSQLDQLEAFLESLAAPLATDARWLAAPAAAPAIGARAKDSADAPETP